MRSGVSPSDLNGPRIRRHQRNTSSAALTSANLQMVRRRSRWHWWHRPGPTQHARAKARAPTKLRKGLGTRLGVRTTSASASFCIRFIYMQAAASMRRSQRTLTSNHLNFKSHVSTIDDTSSNPCRLRFNPWGCVTPAEAFRTESESLSHHSSAMNKFGRTES
jgi:hypothetical protein